jgi:hypothetical protein
MTRQSTLVSTTLARPPFSPAAKMLPGQLRRSLSSPASHADVSPVSAVAPQRGERLSVTLSSVAIAAALVTPLADIDFTDLPAHVRVPIVEVNRYVLEPSTPMTPVFSRIDGSVARSLPELESFGECRASHVLPVASHPLTGICGVFVWAAERLRAAVAPCVRDRGISLFGVGSLQRSCVTGVELHAACQKSLALSEKE